MVARRSRFVAPVLGTLSPGIAYRSLQGLRGGMRLSTLWVWLMYGWGAGEILLALFVRARGGRTTIQDRGTQFILWGVIFGSIFASEWVVHLFPSSIPGGHWLRVAGVALMMIGLAVRITAIVTLGRFFTVNVA